MRHAAFTLSANPVDMTLFELLKHWATLHERLQDDLEHLGATYTLLKYEEFVVDPDSNLRHIYEAVGLDASRANRTIQVEQGTNDKYRKKYCKKISGKCFKSMDIYFVKPRPRFNTFDTTQILRRWLHTRNWWSNWGLMSPVTAMT